MEASMEICTGSLNLFHIIYIYQRLKKVNTCILLQNCGTYIIRKCNDNVIEQLHISLFQIFTMKDLDIIIKLNPV